MSTLTKIVAVVALVVAIAAGTVWYRATGDGVRAAGTWEVYEMEQRGGASDVPAFVDELDAACDIVTTSSPYLIFYRCDD